MTSVEKHLSPKTIFGPGKLPGLSRNGPQQSLPAHKGTGDIVRVILPLKNQESSQLICQETAQEHQFQGAGNYSFRVREPQN